MGRRLKSLLHSPFLLTLAAHLLVSLTIGAVLVALAIGRAGTPGSPWRTSGAADFLRPLYNNPDFFLWLVLAPPLVLMVASLVIGLVFGRWGLPGHLQGRAVYWVPLLSVLYVVGGAFLLGILSGPGVRDVPRMVVDTLGNGPTLMAVGIFAALMTTGVGLGWAVALAVTDHRRRSGKWETIGYVEKP